MYISTRVQGWSGNIFRILTIVSSGKPGFPYFHYFESKYSLLNIKQLFKTRRSHDLEKVSQKYRVWIALPRPASFGDGRNTGQETV